MSKGWSNQQCALGTDGLGPEVDEDEDKKRHHEDQQDVLVTAAQLATH